MTKRSGIYSICLVADGREYIGSSVNIDGRWSRHKKDLRGNKHHSVKLQRAWGKYGEEAFKFTVLELCIPTRSTIIELEQRYIDARRPVFNTSPTAESPLGTKHTDETRRKVSLSSLSTWSKTEFRARHAEGMKAASKKIRTAALQQRKQRSERAIEHNRTYWTVSARALQSKKRKEYARTEAGKAHLSSIGKLVWSKDESRSILTEKRREITRSKEGRARMSSIAKEAWLKPGFAANHSAMVSVAVIGTSLCTGCEVAFKSMKDAAKEVGVSISALSSAIKRKGNSGGYAWRKANES